MGKDASLRRAWERATRGERHGVQLGVGEGGAPPLELDDDLARHDHVAVGQAVDVPQRTEAVEEVGAAERDDLGRMQQALISECQGIPRRRPERQWR